MSQVSVCSGTAQGRSSWRALRPVLILGGFVAVWWALMTGVAHADTDRGPQHHGLDALRTTAKAHVDQVRTPVRAVAHRVHHEAKATTTRAAAPVRHQVRPVATTVKSVTSTVRSTPVVTKAEQAVRTTVSSAVTEADELLVETAVSPVVDTVDDVVEHSSEIVESATGQGNSHLAKHHSMAPRAAGSDVLPTPSAKVAPKAAQAHSAAASTDSGDRPADAPISPSLPDPCTSPSGSGSSSSFAPVGVLESSLLVTPSVLRDHCMWRLARLPGGPAYQPGSSPD